MTALRDDPRNWTDGFTPAPSNFDVKAYQAEIDKITGLARGHRIIRVVWGASQEIEQELDFTAHGTAAMVVKVGKYRTRVKGVPRKVRIRRWIFEEWQPPQQLPNADFIRVPGAGGIYVPPSVLEQRQKGVWNRWYPACDHSKCLPSDCNSDEYFCFGDYRHPDISDLRKIARITRKRLENEHPDPFAPIPQEVIDRNFREANEQREEIERRKQEAIDSVYDDFERTLGRSITSG